MHWREDDEREDGYRVATDVFDLLFRVRGVSLDIDHAWALASALQTVLPEEICRRVGVHGVRLAESGNGWTRPQQQDAELPLSQRSRLVIRAHEADRDALMCLCGQHLSLGVQQIAVGESSVRPLSVSATLHARAVACDVDESETDFLDRTALELKSIGIDVGKMICGKSGNIRTADGSLFTRALMVAGLKADESIRLQREGVGGERLVGCGLFLPHKSIDPVYSMQE